MKTTFHLGLFLVFFGVSGTAWGQPFEWHTATPDSQGMSSAKLQQLQKNLVSRSTQTFLVIRNDRIVYEWYATGHSATKMHYTASMAKAIVAGLSLGVALSDHWLALDDRAAKYIPQWKADPRKSRITLRQLGSHTSGLEDAEEDGVPHQKLTGWKGDFWKRLKVPNDPFTLSRDKARVLFDPGTKFQYSNPGIAMLTYAVTATLREAPHHALALARARDAADRRTGSRLVRRLRPDGHRGRSAAGLFLGRRRLHGPRHGARGPAPAARRRLGWQTTSW